MYLVHIFAFFPPFLFCIVLYSLAWKYGNAYFIDLSCVFVLYMTYVSRFSRVISSRTWNSGNGSPDAVCFSVDKQVSCTFTTVL